MGVISLVATTLVLLISVPSFAQEWIEYENRADFFAVSLPGQPNVKDITFTTEYRHVLPGRVYTYENGPNRYSITVVDYTNLQKMETERVRQCRASGGEGDVCMDNYMHDMRGAELYGAWSLLQKGGKPTHLAYSRMDLVEGIELYLTNADGSRTFAGVHMHDNRLYILEGTVPAKSPPPLLFYQSMGFLDKEGKRVRYQTPYINGITTPSRAR
ncbi:MAG TPA: hypothetical protein VE422_35040 [Terriglobia bacterium]|nr:hypothetical protein [Terriglobia bacterium]